MKSFLIAVVFLVIGGGVGAVVGLGFGAAGGLVTGAQAGLCLAVETAKANGLVSGSQASKLVQDTVATIKGKAGEAATKMEIDWVASEADCTAQIAELSTAGG